MSKRNALRSAILGKSPVFRKEIVEYEGEKYEVRQPSYKARKELFNKCMDENGKIATGEFLTWGVIYNTYVPDSDELVFEESDYDVLMSMPSGGILDKLGSVASKLLNAEDGPIEGK
jgi:hypothetical protein